MYERANETINQGLSLGVRLLLGSVAALLGLMMILIAPPTEKAIFFRLFGGFCLLIAIACLTRGRVRQFVGSIVGAAIFVAGVIYLMVELSSGVLVSGSRSEPSALNAGLYLVFIGIPGAVYAYRTRFGFRKAP